MKLTLRPSVSLWQKQVCSYECYSPHKWWSTLKSVVFSSSSSLPPLFSEGGGLVCELVADLLSDHLGSKQSREAVDLPFTCHPSPCLTTFVFSSSEVRRLLLDLNHYGGTDPLGIFLLREVLMLWPPPPTSLCSISVACSSWLFSGLLETGHCLPNSERCTALLCCQLPTVDNISTVLCWCLRAWCLIILEHWSDTTIVRSSLIGEV